MSERRTDYVVRPRAGASAGQWNAYVAAGPTPGERRARLKECPPEFRDGVESHVRTMFAIRREHAERVAKAREARRLQTRPRLHWEPR
jgi:hypothetical protein